MRCYWNAGHQRRNWRIAHPALRMFRGARNSMYGWIDGWARVGMEPVEFRPRWATMLAFRPAPLGGGGWNGEEESGASIQRKIQGLYAKGGKGCQNLGKPLQNIDHAGDHSHVNHDSVASMQPVLKYRPRHSFEYQQRTTCSQGTGFGWICQRLNPSL